MKSAKVLRGATEILIRLIKDKVWAVYCQGISICNLLFGQFINSNSVGKKEVNESATKVFKELLARTTDTNERVQVQFETLNVIIFGDCNSDQIN